MKRGGKLVYLGAFATAEEAALSYARAQAAVAAAAAPPAPPPMTAEEALRQVEAEGLTLLKSDGSSTGYKGVCLDRKMKTKPYRVQISRGGKTVTLGQFATAEEAALCVARDAAAAAAAPPATRHSLKEAQGQVRGAAARHAGGRARQGRGVAAADAKRRACQGRV